MYTIIKKIKFVRVVCFRYFTPSLFDRTMAVWCGHVMGFVSVCNVVVYFIYYFVEACLHVVVVLNVMQVACSVIFVLVRIWIRIVWPFVITLMGVRQPF